MSVTVGGAVLHTLANVLTGPYYAATCSFSPEGMTIQTMDGSHVSLINATVSKHDFQTYQFRPSGTPNLLVSLDFDVIRQALKPAGRKDATCMTIGGARSRRYHTIGIESDDFTCVFKMNPAQKAPEDLFGIPAAPAHETAVLTIPTAVFKRLFVSGSDFVVVSATQLGITVGDTTFQVTDTDAVERTAIVPTQTFGTHFFKIFHRSIKAAGAKSVTIVVCTDKPAEIRFKIGTQSCVSFHVAPKIDDDDEAA